MKTASFLLTIAFVVFANTTDHLAKSEALVSLRHFPTVVTSRNVETASDEKRLSNSALSERSFRSVARELYRRSTGNRDDTRRYAIDNSKPRETQDRRLVREIEAREESRRTVRDSREREETRRVLQDREASARRIVRTVTRDDTTRRTIRERENSRRVDRELDTRRIARTFSERERTRQLTRDTRDLSNDRREVRHSSGLQRITEGRDSNSARRTVREARELSGERRSVSEVRELNSERRSVREARELNNERRSVREARELNSERRAVRELNNERRSVREARELNSERRAVRELNDERRAVRETRELNSERRSVRELSSERRTISEAKNERRTVGENRLNSDVQLRAAVRTSQSISNTLDSRRREIVRTPNDRSFEGRRILAIDEKDGRIERIRVVPARDEMKRFVTNSESTVKEDVITNLFLSDKQFSLTGKTDLPSISPSFTWNHISSVLFGGAALFIFYAQNFEGKKLAVD